MVEPPHRLPREVLQHLPRLKLVASTGSRNASIDTGGEGTRVHRDRNGVQIFAHNRTDVYCAFIQVSDPVSLTDTSERKMCTGLPSAGSRGPSENSRAAAG